MLDASPPGTSRLALKSRHSFQPSPISGGSISGCGARGPLSRLGPRLNRRSGGRSARCSATRSRTCSAAPRHGEGLLLHHSRGRDRCVEPDPVAAGVSSPSARGNARDILAGGRDTAEHRRDGRSEDGGPEIPQSTRATYRVARLSLRASLQPLRRTGLDVGRVEEEHAVVDVDRDLALPAHPREDPVTRREGLVPSGSAATCRTRAPPRRLA